MRIANDTSLTPPGYSKRAISLAVLIAAYVAMGGWLYYHEERDRILQTEEITLWADARGTVNAITIWHAPIWREGEVFAKSDVVRLFTSPPPPGENPERAAARRQAMDLYLRRFAERTGAVHAAIISPTGTILAEGWNTELQTSGGKNPEAFDAQKAAGRLSQGAAFALPARMGPTGPLLDVIFPVYVLTGATQELGDAPLTGGVVASFTLSDLLDVWTPEQAEGGIKTLLLEREGNAIRSLGSDGIRAENWRNGDILPGLSRKPPSPPQAPTFWRLTEYNAPDGNDDNTETAVHAVAMRVPLQDSWFIVKERSAAPTIETLETLRLHTIIGSFLAGAVLFALLVLRWQWLYGTLEKKLFRAVASSRNEAFINRQMLDLLAAAGTDGICVTGADGRITYANPAFIRHIGRAEADITGENLYLLLDGSRATLHRDFDAKVLGAGTVKTCVETVQNAEDKIPERYTVTKRPLTNIDGKTDGVVTLITLIPQDCAPVTL